MNTISIVSSLYWSLPGPRNFITRIEENAMNSRILWVNLPKETLPGTWEGVQEGLRHGHFNNVITLKINGGIDIAADIGVHFGKNRLTAYELMMLTAAQRSAVILLPEGSAGASNCGKYANEFLDALGKGDGNIHLIVGGHEQSLTKDTADGGIQVIAFDGGLSTDEMDAYVALRMLNRPGPGTTRLTRAVVAEFAGFDVELAEQIMQLNENQIVNITDNLELLMGLSPFRWRHDSWLMRTRSSVAIGVTHVLNDKYLADHGEAGKREEAMLRIKQRYWRACVKTMTPWLEERRADVIGAFTDQIKAEAARNNGKITKFIGQDKQGNDRFALMDPDALEYNNIVGMCKSHKLVLRTQHEVCAENVCRLAKDVRDDIAHLRMPSPLEINRLVIEMDRLLETGHTE